MAQQIADLVVNLTADTAAFKEQMGRVERQLKEAGRKVDASTQRMRQLAEQQAAVTQRAGQSAAAVVQSQRAQAASVARSSQSWAQQAAVVAETHQRVAAYRHNMQQSQTQAAGLAQQQDALTAAFFRQIDGVKQLGGGVNQLQRVQAQLREARKTGNISQQDYLTLLTHSAARVKDLTQAEAQAGQEKARFLRQLKAQVAAQGLSRAEMLRFKAAQLGVSDAADIYLRKLDAAKASVHGLGMKSAAARREMGVMMGELLRGDLGALRGSGITLANNAGLLEKLMSPRMLALGSLVGGVAGALYGLSKAWYQGAQEAVEFNKQLILTGHHAGKTATELQLMAKSLSGNGVTQHSLAETLAKVVGSGSFSSNAIGMIADTAAKLKAHVGQSVDETINQFKRLQTDPVQAVTELDKSLHFLTAAQLEQITTLSEQGRTTDAAALAMDRYASVMRARSDDIRDNLGSLESAWKWLGESAASAWDRMLNIGRETTVKDKIRAIQERLVQFQLDPASKVNYFRATGKTGLDLLQELERLQAQDFSSSLKTAQEKAERDEASRKKRQFEADQALKRQYENAAEKHQRTLAQIEQSAASKAMKEEAIRRENTRYAQESKKGPQYRPPAGERAQEAVQGELLALQAQLQVLRQHTDVNDVISQQRKRLWTEQAKFTVLEDAATRRQLTEQEKSLLASKETVLAQKEKLATVGDEVALQERLNRLHDQADKYLAQQQAKQYAIANSQGLSSRALQRELERQQLYSGQRDNPQLALMQAAQEKTFALEDEKRANWLSGAKSAWAEYQDAALNVYEQIKQGGRQALDGLSSQLSSFLTEGKANFAEFTRSVLKMLADILVKMALVKGINTASSALGYGNLIPNAQGGVYRSPGLSAWSGQRVSRPTLFAFAHGAGLMGEAGPEGIFPLRRGADGKLGVVAKLAGAGMVFAPTYNNTIINDGTNGLMGPQVFKMMHEIGKQAARDLLMEQQRDGGMMRA